MMNLVVDRVLNGYNPWHFPLAKGLVYLAEAVGWNPGEFFIDLRGLRVPKLEQPGFGVRPFPVCIPPTFRWTRRSQSAPPLRINSHAISEKGRMPAKEN